MVWHKSDDDLQERETQLKAFELDYNTKMRSIREYLLLINNLKINVIGDRQKDGTTKTKDIPPKSLSGNKMDESTRSGHKTKLLVNVDSFLTKLQSG